MRTSGPKEDQRMVVDSTARKVTVNTGVREDELDVFLTAHNLMLQTVTAGGFFSLGGMTAVDVHGGTVDAPIFAETASAYTIMDADGKVATLDASTPAVGGWSPLRFARVSLGALGIVTSVTVDVMERPWATTLRAGKQTATLQDETAFVARFQTLLSTHARVESFVNPYNNNFLVLWWDVDSAPSTRTKNAAPSVLSACDHAKRDEFGAPYEEYVLERVAESAAQGIQENSVGELGASVAIDTAMAVISGLFDTAAKANSDLWLTSATRVIFMSYFVELPDLDEKGLGRAWQGLNAVSTRLKSSAEFRLAAPLEFRFVRGGDTALSGTYTETAGARFVNLDMIGYVKAEAASKYPQPLLHFFADIERAWVNLGGMPHNGKMYGFYDPGQKGSFTPPFNPAFLAHLAQGRSDRLKAFEAYRRSRDPNGVFCNRFVHALLGNA